MGESDPEQREERKRNMSRGQRRAWAERHGQDPEPLPAIERDGAPLVTLRDVVAEHDAGLSREPVLDGLVERARGALNNLLDFVADRARTGAAPAPAPVEATAEPAPGPLAEVRVEGLAGEVLELAVALCDPRLDSDRWVVVREALGLAVIAYSEAYPFVLRAARARACALSSTAAGSGASPGSCRPRSSSSSDSAPRRAVVHETLVSRAVLEANQ